MSTVRGMAFPVDLTIGADVLHAGRAEQLAALGHFGVQTPQNAQPEFAVALDGDRAGVREMVRDVGLEFHSLLEIDQIELHLVGRVPEGQIGDHDVEERGLAGAGLAGDQRVLGHAPAQAQVLQTRRARAAERDTEFLPAVEGPDLRVRRSDRFEGDLHARRLRRPCRRCA